jgi:hypothetical protein
LKIRCYIWFTVIFLFIILYCVKDVYQKFINPYFGLFSSDLSIFYNFPFKAKDILISVKKEKEQKNSNEKKTEKSFSSSDSAFFVLSSQTENFTRFDHLLLHYFDALHLQFFCIIAITAKALGHHKTASLCIRYDLICCVLLYDY